MDKPEIDLDEFLDDVENGTPRAEQGTATHREIGADSGMNGWRRPLIATAGSFGMFGAGCAVIAMLIGPAGTSPEWMFLLIAGGLVIGFVLWYWALIAHRPRREQHSIALVCGIAIVPCVVLFSVNGVMRDRIQSDYYTDLALEAHLEGYLNYGQPFDPKANAKMPRLSNWSLDGKIIFVDLETRRFSDVNFELPDELRAKNPEEVRYIAHLSWKSVLIGYYDYDGAKGLRKDAMIVLYDTTTGESTRAEILQGKGPPSSKDGEGDRTGEPPSNDKIIALVLRRYQ